MKLSDFDYYLPKELIAQEPSKRRDASRLLVLDRKKSEISHCRFRDLIDYLKEGDALVLNDTRVIPARLVGRKERTGGKADVLLLDRITRDMFSVLVKPNRRVRVGDKISFNGGGLIGEIIEGPNGQSPSSKSIRFDYKDDFSVLLKNVGKIPLPPYIKREPTIIDQSRYQTVYAKCEGAIAAPTAGLHFTQSFLERILSKGIKIVYLTLHIGYSTFRPVKAEDIASHEMHREYFVLAPETASILNETKEKGNKILAVGTTTTRVLETQAYAVKSNDEDNFRVKAGQGWTELFIYPPYRFRIVDVLLTNFHLPRTTLLMLVSAFSDRELLLRAYKEAIARKYRFYSYGDAMLVK